MSSETSAEKDGHPKADSLNQCGRRLQIVQLNIVTKLQIHLFCLLKQTDNDQLVGGKKQN